MKGQEGRKEKRKKNTENIGKIKKVEKTEKEVMIKGKTQKRGENTKAKMGKEVGIVKRII